MRNARADNEKNARAGVGWLCFTREPHALKVRNKYDYGVGWPIHERTQVQSCSVREAQRPQTKPARLERRGASSVPVPRACATFYTGQ
jgi:hypothetical protein